MQTPPPDKESRTWLKALEEATTVRGLCLFFLFVLNLTIMSHFFHINQESNMNTGHDGHPYCRTVRLTACVHLQRCDVSP